MQATDYIWKNGRMIHWSEAQTHVLSHGLHYGSAVFEGIRCYKTELGPAVLKLKEHMQRFLYSSHHLAMKYPYKLEDLCRAVLETVRKNGLEEGYIRPLAYYGYGSLKVVPPEKLEVDIVIACWPWADYFEVPTVDVIISSFIRIHRQSTITDAKISGHYVNSILSGLAIRHTPYHEVLLLDVDGFVAEGGASNIFIVKAGRLITTPLGTILPGVTREIVINMAKEAGFSVEERYFKPDEIYASDEAFFTGTAVEIMPIRSLDDRLIGNGQIGPVTQKIKQHYQEIVRGKIPYYHEALTWI